MHVWGGGRGGRKEERRGREKRKEQERGREKRKEEERGEGKGEKERGGEGKGEGEKERGGGEREIHSKMNKMEHGRKASPTLHAAHSPLLPPQAQ